MPSVEREESGVLWGMQLYMLSSQLAADAGHAQQKALTRPPAFRMAATAVG